MFADPHGVAPQRICAEPPAIIAQPLEELPQVGVPSRVRKLGVANRFTHDAPPLLFVSGSRPSPPQSDGWPPRPAHSSRGCELSPSAPLRSHLSTRRSELARTASNP